MSSTTDDESQTRKEIRFFSENTDSQNSKSWAGLNCAVLLLTFPRPGWAIFERFSQAGSVWADLIPALGFTRLFSLHKISCDFTKFCL